MIIDSHAHYAHPNFKNEFPYLDGMHGNYVLSRADRRGLVERMQEKGIVGWLEPSIGFDDIAEQLKITEEYQKNRWVALGVHPTRCFEAGWKNRKELKKLVEQTKIVAIGETGLDYHLPPDKQHRLVQKLWFHYLLRLADKLELPLVLHIREADKDALKILKRHKKQLHGGVVHCFSGDQQTAQQYLDLGLKLGIGGFLLREDARGKRMQQMVKQVPLASLLVETDAPYVLPEVGPLPCSGKQRKRIVNTSMILPNVIEKIAALRGENYQVVEDAIFRNTVETFHLQIGETR